MKALSDFLKRERRWGNRWLQVDAGVTGVCIELHADPVSGSVCLTAWPTGGYEIEGKLRWEK